MSRPRSLPAEGLTLAGVFVCVAYLLTSCRQAVLSPVDAVVGKLIPTASVELGSAGSAVAFDGEHLLLAQIDGGVVIKLDTVLRSIDTVILNPRVVGARGLMADRFYIYAYDDQRLYRGRRPAGGMEVWLNNLRVAGLAVYAPGEVLVSETSRGSIWYKTLFMESRRFTDPGSVDAPGAIVAAADGRFYVTSGDSSLCELDRSGNVTGRRPRPPGTDLMASGPNGDLYLMRRGSAVLWQMAGSQYRAYELETADYPDALVTTGSGIVILDRARRLIMYRLPEK